MMITIICVLGHVAHVDLSDYTFPTIAQLCYETKAPHPTWTYAIDS